MLAACYLNDLKFISKGIGATARQKKLWNIYNACDDMNTPKYPQ